MFSEQSVFVFLRNIFNTVTYYKILRKVKRIGQNLQMDMIIKEPQITKAEL